MIQLSTPSLESHFSVYRRHVIGQQQYFDGPFGRRQLLYADWTASGRAYGPIEKRIRQEILPFVGNTHTGTTITGTLMSEAYTEAKKIIKAHVHANEEDVLLFCGSGMTSAVNKLQRLMGLRMPEHARLLPLEEAARPVVFVTHMEHHSNHLSWLETVATVEIIARNNNGNTDLMHLNALLERYRHRPLKIAAITACSNVTGIQTPYHQVAQLMHQHDGLCFVDFACSAPYVDMNMHPEVPGAHLDAIYFSGHKFLGGPGTPGILVFNRQLYRNTIPDHPGGGTVHYSNPWKVHAYLTDIEQREDGGTPPFLAGIKAALCIRLKEAMGTPYILAREAALLRIIFHRLARIPQVQVLEPDVKDRLGVVAFLVTGTHYNLVVRLLNDHFGIQLRGGCSCAGTYGHLLLDVPASRSYAILKAIQSDDLSAKPGWIRLSIHPTMTDEEIHFIMDALETMVSNICEWEQAYHYDPHSNEYYHKAGNARERQQVLRWFDSKQWNDDC
ncbi:aminotransferase class V-fold PLP-dependent enzyme [Chitinophaga eiseniae]|uniref:Aminotransferase class V-fold PLP-dependent enzyme n=1 Tax=Chitinophaga eiseniae TaxID=634771 RepID=A0A847SJP3_9BACT|nr:aminotransferase class V-fold PLP-dependent enzyme [Chitinophaga eiseniae]NLR77359.1 aminotransferase class V-fold PLP-dependent enzyme [Chitinophaga eiseniae]